MILKNCRLVPELCEGFQDEAADIRIEGDTIAEILPAGGTYVGEEVLDCTGKTVLPGLFNLHMHLFFKGDEFTRTRVRNEHEISILAIRYMQELLAYGYTSLRDAGAQFDIAIKLRDDINKGLITGPHMKACGYILTPDHVVVPEGDVFGGYSSSCGEPINGPYAARTAVRRQLAKGADYIKLLGCSNAPGKRGNGPLFYEDELHEFVETAKRERTYLAVHTNDPESLDVAIDMEARTIEHASFMTPDHVDRLKKHGNKSTIVPTFAVTWAWGEKICTVHNAGIRYAYDAGLPLCWGTDAAEDVFLAEPAAEFIARNKVIGIPAVELLKQATIFSANVFDSADCRGSIKVGKKADFAIFNGNPDQDLTLFNNPCAYVLKDGALVAENGKIMLPHIEPKSKLEANWLNED